MLERYHYLFYYINERLKIKGILEQHIKMSHKQRYSEHHLIPKQNDDGSKFTQQPINRERIKDKNGRPYLESHHVITLAENGPDAIYNTVAICPNCHRRIHMLHQKEDVERLSKVIMNYLLSDEDKENIKKWEELFKN